MKVASQLSSRTLALGILAAMVFGCQRPGSNDEPDAASSGVLPTSGKPAAAKPASFASACDQVRACCVAIAKQPGLEMARPVCQLYWLRDVIGDEQPRPEKLCQMEIVQMENLWNVYSMTDAGASAKMPSECKWSHPKLGPMPFTPLGPLDGGTP
jgi:hypothetical protein